jgi:hypothetical protein
MSGSLGFQPIQLYQLYSGKESTYATASLKANPQATSLINYFNANAAGIKTPAQLLGNYKILSVVLGAFNLQSSIKDTALLKQLMTQNPTSSSSLAQKLGNAQYLLFAQALSNWTTPPFASASDRAQLVSSYTTNTFEQTANTEAPGLANALYFTREAPNIKSITALQSDSQLLQVAVTATGISYNDYVELSFTQQTNLLTSKIKVSQLQTPSYVKQLAEQYLAQQAGSGSSTPAPGSVASLFSDDPSADDSDSVLNILDPSANLDPSSSGDSSSGNLLSLFA